MNNFQTWLLRLKRKISTTIFHEILWCYRNVYVHNLGRGCALYSVLANEHYHTLLFKYCSFPHTLYVHFICHYCSTLGFHLSMSRHGKIQLALTLYYSLGVFITYFSLAFIAFKVSEIWNLTEFCITLLSRWPLKIEIRSIQTALVFKTGKVFKTVVGLHRRAKWHSLLLHFCRAESIHKLIQCMIQHDKNIHSNLWYCSLFKLDVSRNILLNVC